MQEFERNYINRIVAGKGALLVSLLAAFIMSLLAATLFPGRILAAPDGICLPAPESWELSPVASYLLNTLLIYLSCFGAILLNKRFNFIPGSGVLYASLYIFAAMASPMLDKTLSSSTVIVCIVLACSHMLFNLYERRNASTGIFLLFTILSWGSMIQYACLLLIPIFMLGAYFLKAFHFKEFLASLLGLFAPYWIVFGTGMLPLDSITFPPLSNIFEYGPFTPEYTMMLITLGVISIGFIIMLIADSMQTYSLGVKMRAYNSFVNLLGTAMIWYMVFDTANLTAYAATLALSFGFQGGRFFLTSRLRKAYIVLLAIPAIFIILFIYSMA